MKNKLNLEKFNGEKFSPLTNQELSFFRGGRECATGSGTFMGQSYSADTAKFYDSTGEQYGTTYHTETDKSCAPSC